VNVPAPVWAVSERGAIMTVRNGFRRLAAVCALAVVVGAGGPALAQESAGLATELAELLSAAGLEAIAAKDTEGTDRFVAALAFPGQLLVVSARYEVPMYVEAKIVRAQYREVYIDLNAASIAETKVLITDIGADGLSEADMVDTGSGPSPYDGDTSADAQYARMLSALIEQAR
jgi:hypothetical protein